MARIAAVGDNVTQFLSIREGLLELERRGHEVVVFLPEDAGYGDLIASTRRVLEDWGMFPASRVDPKNAAFDVLLESYSFTHLASMSALQARVRVKFPYALMAAKPSHTYLPAVNEAFDAILVHSRTEKDVLSVYGRTHQVSPVRAAVSEPEPAPDSADKRMLLYLPTFGDFGGDAAELEAAFADLRADYRVCVKLHPTMEFKDEERGHVALLRSISDQCFGHDTELTDLLAEAALVLTGNSGSLFDAMYAGRPVAVYSSDLAKNRLVGPTMHEQLVEARVVPHASVPAEIPAAIREAELAFSRQRAFVEEEFVTDACGASEFADVVEGYAQSPPDRDTAILLRRYYKQVMNERVSSTRESFESSLSWKLTQPVRALAALCKRPRTG